MAATQGTTTPAVNFLPHLSYDATLEVLSLLSVNDLGRLAQVSRDTNAAADDSVVWRRLCRGLEADWQRVLCRANADVPKLTAEQTAEDWKNAFQKERERVQTTSKFVGMWNEKWCDVNVQQSTLIESDGYNFSVTYKKNKFSARFRDFDGETLTFELEGGDSGWSFLYKVKPISDALLHLTVFRVHDQKSFSGVFSRI